MEGHNSKIGRLGEDLAGRFLEKNGYQIIDRNFSTCYGEIDLIAELGEEILFCEVKTRSSLQYGYPELAVGAKKLEHFLGAAKIYLKLKPVYHYNMAIRSKQLTGKKLIICFKRLKYI